MASPQKAKGEEVSDSPFLNEWGFTLKDLYNLAFVFYKEQQGKALQISYESRIRLSALSCQIKDGKFDSTSAPPLGLLDVIGKDRRMVWQSLGEKSRPDCMFEFVSLVDKTCPLFRPFVEAHKEAQKKNVQETETQGNGVMSEEEVQAAALAAQAEANRLQLEEQKRRIQDALNAQTFEQFRIYAEQQFPSNPEQQGVLIRQLQEQHYEQYMRQLVAFPPAAQQQSQQPTNNATNPSSTGVSSSPPDLSSLSLNNNSAHGEQEADQDAFSGSSDEHEEDENNTQITDASSKSSSKFPPIAAASMWTRKDVADFRAAVRAEGGESVLRIGQGESVTVRVPTHPDGACLFWEFSTDAHDIGFGLFFEWTPPGAEEEEQVSVHVTEDSDDEDEDEEEVDEDDEAFAQLRKDLKGDVERGALDKKPLNTSCLPRGSKPNTEVVIPVYRRDAQAEVYVGSHLFPGKGVYLLRFDNSYSFWRSKTLYYRVYYTK